MLVHHIPWVTVLTVTYYRLGVLAGVDPAAAGLRGLGQQPAAQETRGQAGH